MKQILALLLVAAFVLCGCAPKQQTIHTIPPVTVPPQPTGSAYVVDHVRKTVLAGSVTTKLSTQSGGQVSYDAVYAGVPGQDHTDPKTYTFREAISGTTGMKWAPHTWETADDRYILEYTTTGFYDFVLDADGSGWTIVAEMAAAAPEDVTAEYVGRFDITAEDTARAWKIPLNPAACWDNGEKITADTYIYSYQQLLDGKMMNRRADSLYAGEFAIQGAKDYLYGKCQWDQVGILKTGEYELVLITAAPVTDPAFYVPYNLTSTYLVYAPLWERCKTCFDKNGNVVGADSPEVATVSTNYATSLDTSISYGPYRLTYFELDKQIILERNDTWYGYHDGRHLGQYQTDRVICSVIAAHDTALLSFLNGELDTIDLQAQDMATYSASDAIRYRPESYTTKLSFNTDAKSLSKRGSQVLANANFRKGLSLAIDRTRFAAGYTSAGAPGYGLINYAYVYDPFTGASYRQSVGAKNALVRLYDIRTAEFGDLEGAYRAITGYDPDLARGYMQLAYEQCVADGSYDGESPIELQLSVYQSQDLYVQMFRFLHDALDTACRGTGFEGKIRMQMAVDADYYATMESGLTDMIFSTWGGSAYDPYGILYRCYCDAGQVDSPNQMEFGFDSAKVTVTVTVDGVSHTHSLQDWARWCAGDPEVTLHARDGTALRSFREYDSETRCAIYSDLEYAYLGQYVTTPLYYRNAATLVSRKGDYPSRAYIESVEFGGIRFYTYHYDDAAWETVRNSLTY